MGRHMDGARRGHGRGSKRRRCAAAVEISRRKQLSELQAQNVPGRGKSESRGPREHGPGTDVKREVAPGWRQLQGQPCCEHFSTQRGPSHEGPGVGSRGSLGWRALKPLARLQGP